jgi:hypothetical protein
MHRKIKKNYSKLIILVKIKKTKKKLKKAKNFSKKAKKK